MPRSPRISEAAKTASPKAESKATNLKAVADHLGLSVAAISRVLSGAPAARSIPKVTQDRIFAAAEMLNYRPNLFARSLRNRRSQTVGVIVPEVSEGYADACVEWNRRCSDAGGLLLFSGQPSSS